MGLAEYNNDCNNLDTYYDDVPSYDCDDPYEHDAQEVDEEIDDYIRDSVGNVVRSGNSKVKKGDMNFGFTKGNN